MRLIITLILSITSIVSNVYSQQYKLENYGLAQGLNSPKVETIMQDSRGFIWVGTYQGLSRFDGQNFINYTSVGDRRIGTIFCIRELDYGVIIFAGMEGIFVHKDNKVYLTPWLRSDTENHSVNELTIDEKKNIWVASTLGPYKIPYKEFYKAIDNPDFSMEMPILKAWNESKLIDKRCAKITFDSIGNIWIANDYYLTKYNGDSLQILYDAYGSKSLKISAIFPQFDNSAIWSASELYMYHTTDGMTSPIWAPIKYPTKVFEQGNNNYYILTAFELYNVKHNVPSKLFDTKDYDIQYPRDIIIDIEEDIWLASHSGLYKVVHNKIKTIENNTYTGSSELYGIGLLNSGSIIMGGNHGKVFISNSGLDSKIELFDTLNIRSEIVDFYEEQSDKLWIATNYQGLVLHEKGKSKRYTESDGLLNNGLKCIFKSSKNEMWIGGELGATQIVTENQREVTFKKYMYGNPVANYFQVNQIIEGPDQQLWFASNFGLHHIKNDSLQPYLLDIENNSELYIFDGIVSRNGNAYFATGGSGVIECKFSNSGEPIVKRIFNKNNDASSNTFIDIIETKNGEIWSAGYNEICLIQDLKNHDPHLPICYNKNNGYGLDTYSSIKMVEDTAGTIWIATPSGLANFDPDALKPNNHTPYVHIYDVLIDGQHEELIKYGEGIDSITGLVSELSLPYHKNYISFHFNAISLRDLNSINYSYQLIGVDKEPHYTTSNNIINYPNLASGKYTFTLNASNSFGISNKNPLSYSFEIRPAFWKTKWFLISSLLLGFLLVRYYFKRKEKIYKKNEKEKNKVNKLIAELKIRAIRSQMNPHFMFNCLNAIQSCIVAQESDVASKYLTKFSKLLRMVLNYSEKDYLSLDDEIAFLTLYLELEKLRFGKSLEYNIEISEEVDPEEYILPSFLIQPFIENSIWHGLMHKSDNRKLWLRFHVSEDEEILHCIIEDNGIGREKSAALKKNNNSSIKHQSKGMRLSTERIELIKLQSGEKINFEIEDLKDKNNTPTGTKVILRLPVNYEN